MGTDRMVVNASWGLGEAISMGEVPGDLFWIDRERGEATAVRPGRPGRWIVPDREQGGTKVEELPEELRGRACLDETQLLRLAELGRLAEDEMGGPMNIEFGFDEEDAPLLFQVRRVPRRAE